MNITHNRHTKNKNKTCKSGNGRALTDKPPVVLLCKKKGRWKMEDERSVDVAWLSTWHVAVHGVRTLQCRLASCLLVAFVLNKTKQKNGGCGWIVRAGNRNMHVACSMLSAPVCSVRVFFDAPCY